MGFSVSAGLADPRTEEGDDTVVMDSCRGRYSSMKAFASWCASISCRLPPFSAAAPTAHAPGVMALDPHPDGGRGVDAFQQSAGPLRGEDLLRRRRCPWGPAYRIRRVDGENVADNHCRQRS
jgi:hypothetical protein